MTVRKRFRLESSEAIHATAVRLHKVGALDKATMRDFDARHLVVPDGMEPADIKKLCEASSVSQPVFARYLNTSESTVEKWETAERHGAEAVEDCQEACTAGSGVRCASTGSL